MSISFFIHFFATCIIINTYTLRNEHRYLYQILSLSATGLELLLDEVYDTAFSGLEAGRSFSQSNMYRILQRRYLAVQLALTGRFRCEFKYAINTFYLKNRRQLQRFYLKQWKLNRGLFQLCCSNCINSLERFYTRYWNIALI